MLTSKLQLLNLWIGIDWSAFSGFRDLRSFALENKNGNIRQARHAINVSMDDLAQLPSSLTDLQITGICWVNSAGNLDIGRLPRELIKFEASCCKEMDGELNLAAPQQSKLREIHVNWNKFKNIIGSKEYPPLLRELSIALVGSADDLPYERAFRGDIGTKKQSAYLRERTSVVVTL